jgi:hypothetical protein
MRWTLHFLEAEGSLGPWRERLQAEAAETYDRLEALLRTTVPMSAIDIIVQRVAGGVIPEIGIGGSCYRQSCMAVTLDPDNPNFAAGLESGYFARTLAHELHHCLRYGGPGYGRTLGEALVSEGLADHFDCQAHGGDGQPWNHALTPQQWRPLLQRAEAALSDPLYDHDAWFFGAGGAEVLPRWAGYTIAYHLVAAYLDAHPDARPSQLVHTEAAGIIREGWPGLVARHGRGPIPIRRDYRGSRSAG